jgi:hypothetical protein
MALEAKLQASDPANVAPAPQATPAYRPPPAAAAPVYQPRTPLPPAQPVMAYKKAAATPVPKQQVVLTQKEKQQLKDDIFKLPSHKLGPVVDIISKAMPKTEQVRHALQPGVHTALRCTALLPAVVLTCGTVC